VWHKIVCCDWSSDVCSSDLSLLFGLPASRQQPGEFGFIGEYDYVGVSQERPLPGMFSFYAKTPTVNYSFSASSSVESKRFVLMRSEERRGGKDSSDYELQSG